MSKKYDYFDALSKMAKFSCDISNYFDEVVNNFDPSTISSKITEMHLIEHAADEQRHEIVNTLAKDFLPPIEQEDIANLASKIDDVVDCIDDVIQHLYIYNVSELLPECKVFSALIQKSCDSIYRISLEFARFRKSTTIQKDIVITNDIESQGDRLYAETMRRIFTSDMEIRDIFIWERLITSFEACFDYCEDVAELFESAIMKNS
ncbi:MAG: DUF47 family protein [Oscillospiraceae bacterium]|nr:DUF47 family protein [Oscillospiraceae bacterium]